MVSFNLLKVLIHANEGNNWKSGGSSPVHVLPLLYWCFTQFLILNYCTVESIKEAPV
jgi:hypothetical protein